MPHTTSRAAIVQVLEGRLRSTADGEEIDAGSRLWLHMTAGNPHASRPWSPP